MVKTRDNTLTEEESPQNEQQGVLEGLRVGSKWAVGADNLNIVLFKRNTNKKTGKEYWVAEGYFATPQGALNWLVHQEIRDTHLVGLKTVCARIDQLEKEISAMTLGQFRKVENAGT